MRVTGITGTTERNMPSAYKTRLKTDVANGVADRREEDCDGDQRDSASGFVCRNDAKWLAKLVFVVFTPEIEQFDPLSGLNLAKNNLH
jgi:hypothetical protein